MRNEKGSCNFARPIEIEMLKRTILFILFLVSGFIQLSAGNDSQRFTLQGKVVDAGQGEGLGFVTIRLFVGDRFLSGLQTSDHGTFHFSNLQPQRYRLQVSSVGYAMLDTLVTLRSNQQCTLRLHATAVSLGEVTITAQEKKGLTSTSVIDRTAMQHLQPSSFSDLLSLLPGGMTSTPHTNVANVARLREVGISSSDYAISSLGTKFMVDGAPIGTDANMQLLGRNMNADGSRSTVGYGVDMRMLATDNIERVEVVRCIPSVKYGDLTSGLIRIERKRVATPLEVRIKADGYGKLLSMGKGFALGSNWILNTDGGLFNSKADPRNRFETYNRLNFSARLHKFWLFAQGGRLNWDVASDYAGNIDHVKTDPEVQVNKEDRYRSSYHHVGLSTSLRYSPHENSWLKSLLLRYSTSVSFDEIDQTKFVSVDRDTPAPLIEENGEYDGTYLPSTYVARHQVKGMPFYSNLRLEGNAQKAMGAWSHLFTMGIEWQYNKNFGQGQVYDYLRPIDGTSSRRPRTFKAIPATNVGAFYAQDEAKLSLGNHVVTALLGVRGTTMLGLSSAYDVHGKLYVDPRLNVQWDLPAMGTWRLYVSVGLGRMSKMPTILDLNPEKRYIDLVQLNYWNANDAAKKLNIRSYTIDTNNYHLVPAHNTKWEIRVGGSSKGHQFYATYFHESMNDGFRSTQQMIPMLTYKDYDDSSLRGVTLTAPPSLATLPFRNDTLLRTYQVMGNGTKIIKQGIEFQYSSPRLVALHTRFTFNGAWFHTTYAASEPEYYAGSPQQINGITINNRYLGIYAWDNGYVKDQFTSNLIADTYLDRLGLILSATAECYWLGRTLTPTRNPRPLAYVDVAGVEHPYTAADATDVYKRWLVLSNVRQTQLVQRERAYMCLNIKASKAFGRHATLSFFADRLLSIAPDYEVNGYVVRRVFTPYFGMELNFKL